MKPKNIEHYGGQSRFRSVLLGFATLLSLTLFLFASNLFGQSSDFVEITGRVVDRSGRPVCGADVFLEPISFESDGFDRFVNSFVTKSDGRFSFRRYKRNESPEREWMVFVTENKTDALLSLVEAPFDLLRRGDSHFDGVRVNLGHGNVDLGDLPVRFTFGDVAFDFKKFAIGGSLNPKFLTDMTLRVLGKNGWVAEELSLSRNDIDQILKSQMLRIECSLPLGNWRLVVLNGKEIVGSTSQFNVTQRKQIVYINKL